MAYPIVYEDFLPVSAAGIFQSNLGGDASQANAVSANRAALEAALGVSIIDEFALYEAVQNQSKQQALATVRTESA